MNLSLDELRQQIHTATPMPSKTVATGLAPLDALLAGGIPTGRLIELVGGRASCATSIAVHTLATATARGDVVAYIDKPDSFDPRSAAEARLDLARTLWIRPTTLKDAYSAADLILNAGGFAVVALDLWEERPAIANNESSTRRRFTPTPSIFLRLARAAERSKTTLLIIAHRHLAGTFAALTLECARKSVLVVRIKTASPGRSARLAWSPPRVT